MAANFSKPTHRDSLRHSPIRHSSAGFCPMPARSRCSSPMAPTSDWSFGRVVKIKVEMD
jgi:hypothetical protein